MAGKAMTEEFQTDGAFDVYKMLDIVRERPKMYLGDESLTRLWWLLQGYEWALTDNDVPHRKVGPFDLKFHYFVRIQFHLRPNVDSYANMILEQCDSDEAKALAKFFDLLDEFRRQEES